MKINKTDTNSVFNVIISAFLKDIKSANTRSSTKHLTVVKLEINMQSVSADIIQKRLRISFTWNVPAYEMSGQSRTMRLLSAIIKTNGFVYVYFYYK